MNTEIIGANIRLARLFHGLSLADLGELLDAPSLDDPATKVRDTLLPGIVDVGSYDGTFLSLDLGL